ncbi:hypothetical protein [Microbacterium sp. SORGH_AS_0862]|uniref:hypothetical protein n=1 Tax=Microbacterium sp. SORGH_AS_0862 TaxID=3041789 RepID=UPI00278EE26F|nr:hypothetical protein [Microbacterium sp. SORGH_AS_0862]MDQ1204439.1 putative membrane protein [Microbacterium sp. SORGH_AS_0862]
MTRASRTWRAVSVVAAVLVVGVAVSAVLLVLADGIAATFAGSYGAPTVVGSARRAQRSAQTLQTAVLVLGLALVGVLVLFAIVRRRSRRRRLTSIICGVLLSLALVAELAGIPATIGQAADEAARLAQALPVPTADPAPTPAAPAAPSAPRADAVRAEMRSLIERSVAAAGGTALGADGAELAASDIPFDAAPCGETGTRLSAQFSIRAADPDEAVARLLRIWEDAGYAPDRGMQQDARYSETLLVERMSVRAASPIRVSVEGACAVP